MKLPAGALTRWLFLLRAFLPSWRFFDDVGTPLTLKVRFGVQEDRLGDWTSALPPIPRSLKNLVLNPQSNYLHAAQNHLTHLAQDLSQWSQNEYAQIEKQVSYRLTRNMAEFQIRERGWAKPPFIYQFQLIADGHQSVLISPLYESSKWTP